MKKSVLFLMSVLFTASLAYGQGGKYGKTEEDSIQCIKSLNLYRDFRDNNNIEKAIPHWRKALDVCPKASKRLYIDGEKFYEYNIKKAEKKKDSTLKEKYIDSLLWVFDKRIEHYGQEAYVLGKKGSDLLKYRKETHLQEANKMLEKSIEGRKEKSTASVLARYYFSLYYLYKQEKIEKDKIIEEYLPISKYVQYNIDNPSKPAYKKYYQKAKQKVDKVFTVVAKCEDIVKNFNKRMEEGDVPPSTMRTMYSAMKTRKCEDDPLYPKLAKEVYKSDPDARSAYSIGTLELGNEKYESAQKYFQEAIDLGQADTSNVDSSSMAKYYIGAGQAANKRGLSSKAYQYAQKALDFDPEEGRAYVIMADAIANSSDACGSNPFEKGAVYWLAADYIKKARGMGEKMDEIVDKKLGYYRGRFPDKETTFNHGYLDKVGQQYEIGCWINQSTTIRKSW